MSISLKSGLYPYCRFGVVFDTRRQRRGSALVLAVLVAAVFLIMGNSMLGLGLQSQKQAILTGREVEAKCAADAGMTMALYEMNEKLKAKSWSDSSLPQASDVSLPNSNAIYTFTVTGDSTSGYTITSTGTSGTAIRTVSATLEQEGEKIEYVIFADREIVKLGSGITISGYNSEDTKTVKSKDIKAIKSKSVKTIGNAAVVVGTNSTQKNAVKINKIKKLVGDVAVGPDGDPEDIVKGLDKITGTAYAADELTELSTVVPPELPSKGELSINKTTITLGESDSGRYSSVEIEKGTLQIKGDVVLYFSDETDLNKGEIVVGKDSSLTIYLGGNVVSKNPDFVNFVNLTEEPNNLTIYGTSSGIYQIGSEQDFYGTVYAPNAYLYLYTTGGDDIYGAFTADRIRQEGNGDIYYDYALGGGAGNTGSANKSFVIGRWQEWIGGPATSLRPITADNLQKKSL